MWDERRQERHVHQCNGESKNRDSPLDQVHSIAACAKLPLWSTSWPRASGIVTFFGSLWNAVLMLRSVVYNVICIWCPLRATHDAKTHRHARQIVKWSTFHFLVLHLFFPIPKFSCSQGRNQLIFSGGQNDVNLLLYLTNTYVFKNFGGGHLPDCPPSGCGPAGSSRLLCHCRCHPYLSGGMLSFGRQHFPSQVHRLEKRAVVRYYSGYARYKGCAETSLEVPIRKWPNNSLRQGLLPPSKRHTQCWSGSYMKHTLQIK